MAMGSRVRRIAALLGAALVGLAAGTGSAGAASLVPTAAEPAGPRPKLHRCDLGMPRPFQCGHITVPMLRSDPGLGDTKVAFAIRPRRDASQPSLGTIFAMDGGPGYASTAKPYAASLIAALARSCAAATSSSTTCAAPASPTRSTARPCRAA
jgi:hypothetical protein